MSNWHRQDLAAANKQIDRLVAENRRLHEKVERLGAEIDSMARDLEAYSDAAQEIDEISALLDAAIADRDAASISAAEMDEFLTAALEDRDDYMRQRDALLAEVAALKAQLAEEKPARKRKGA